MSLLIISTLLTILSVTFYLYVKHIYSYWKRKGVPYIEPSIPFGNFGPTFKGAQSIGLNLDNLYNASTEPFVGTFFFLRPILLLRDPKIIRDVLIKDFQYFRDRGFHFDSKVDSLVGNLFSSDESWKENRAKLSPAFTSGKLKGMFDIIVDCAKPLEECIEKYAVAGKEAEVRELFFLYTTNAIASTGFGLDIDSFKNPKNEFREKARIVFEPLIRNIFRFSMSFTSPYLTKLLGLRFTDKDVEDFMIEIVRNNLEYREKNNIVRKDFFQLLMQIRNGGKVQDDGDDWNTKTIDNKKSLSIKEMAAHTFLFIIAGYESSATTMTFFMYEMANNQDIQQKVYNEITDVLQKYDGKLTYESLNEMKYLECCIDEVLRLHPAFSILSRECTKDYKIADSNVVIEKGTTVFIPINAPQYDPKYYDQPNKFIPERFINDQSINKNSSDKPYLTFGDGPRNCIGLRLGKLQAKIGVCILLRKFLFELGEKIAKHGLELNPITAVKTPIDGMMNLKVTLR